MPLGEIELGIARYEKFRLVRSKLKEADKSLRLKFMRNIRAALKPLGKDISESAEEKLPKRGGLNKKIANSRYATRTKALSVTFQTTNLYQIQNMDKGIVRHPVFGNDDSITKWVDQKITPNFWTEPIEKAKPEVQASVDEAIAETLEELSE